MIILTVDEFIARIGDQEADTVAGEGPRGARRLDLIKLGAAIAWAGELITGYIRARYPADIVPVPDLLKGFCVDIAFYRLRYKAGDQSGVNAEVRQRYDDAIARLRDIQSGRLAIDANQPGAGNVAATEMRVSVAGHPSKAREVLDGWRLSVEGARR